MAEGDTEGFLERLRNSPRTVSAIIVVLIVLGAIFAFSDRGSRETPTPSPEGSVAPTEEAESPTPTASGEESSAKTSATPRATQKGAVKPTQTPTPAPLPEARETETSYVEVAARGNGVTHLARRAMLRYLEAQKPDYIVTAEHKVWMEDHLKDALGRKPLALGANLEIQKDLVREAVASAKQLSDAQLKHLQRFSQRVALYRS